MSVKGNGFFNPRGMSPAERAKLENLNAESGETKAVTHIAFVTLAEGGTIDEVTATEHLEVFAEWEPNVNYVIGNLRRYGEKLYKCVQAHTSQADWAPDKTPALWVRCADPGVFIKKYAS